MAKLTRVRKSGYRLTEPIIRLLVKTNVTPNTITWVGFSIALGAAALIATGHLFIAGFVVLASGFFDMLDGALARHSGQVTRSGGILDSILDRISEAMLLLGVLICYLLSTPQPGLGILLVSLALIGSPMVSYIRARAEAAGLECQVGIFTRAERVITLAIGLLLSHLSYAMNIAIGIIALFSFITAGQRLCYVLKQANK